MRRAALPLLLCLAHGLAACSSIDETYRDSAEAVLTLRSGTMSELRQRVGSGPFRTYEVPPAEMLEVLQEAVGEARGVGGKPVSAVFVSERRGQVVAKERPADEADDDGYSKPFLSAMIAAVSPLKDRPDACRVEIHAMRSGPFHTGRVQWVRDMPAWIDGVLAKRRSAAAAPLAPLPPEPGLKPIP